MESVIFNYLRESLKLEQEEGNVILMLRNPDGKWVEISRVKNLGLQIIENPIFNHQELQIEDAKNMNPSFDYTYFKSRTYLSNDD